MNAKTLGLLIHYYWSPVNHEQTSPTLKEGHAYLVNHALLTKLSPRAGVFEYHITERGRVHVKNLIDHSLPVRKWTHE